MAATFKCSGRRVGAAAEVTAVANVGVCIPEWMADGRRGRVQMLLLLAEPNHDVRHLRAG